MRWIRAFAIVSVFCLLGAHAVAAQERVPDAGNLDVAGFMPNFDGICGLGETISQGCEAIRAREIVDAAAAPWRAIGRVNSADMQSRQHCTGTLVSANIVLTAAHCLYNFPRRHWIAPGNVIFVAGFQRGAGVAVSRGQRFVLSAAENVASRDFRSTPRQDWALLILEEPIGEETGYLEMADPGSLDFGQVDYRMAGYSGLRPNVLSVAADCGAPLADRLDVILQRCSGMPGDSGAPLLIVSGEEYLVAGVFSSIVGSGGGVASLAVSVSEFSDALAREVGE